MHSTNDIINFSNNANECDHLNTCFYSSFVFVINILLALYCEYYLYAALFCTLLITSLLHHSHYNCLTTIVDKIAIYCVVLYGGHLFYMKILVNNEMVTAKQGVLSVIIGITFLSTIVLYYYGYLHSCLCFSADKTQSYLFHSLIHYITTIGHCCIMLL
jgi:hypothetical protein